MERATFCLERATLSCKVIAFLCTFIDLFCWVFFIWFNFIFIIDLIIIIDGENSNNYWFHIAINLIWCKQIKDNVVSSMMGQPLNGTHATLATNVISVLLSIINYNRHSIIRLVWEKFCLGPWRCTILKDLDRLQIKCNGSNKISTVSTQTWTAAY